MRYFFILGRNPELSLAELNAVLPEQCSIQSRCGSVAIADCPEINVSELMKKLGGTIKIGVILPVCHFDRTPPWRGEWRNLTQYIWQGVRSLGLARDDSRRQKIFIGVSAYALNEKMRLPTPRELRQIGIEIKRDLQAQGYKVRLVTSRDIALSSVIVEKEKLLKQGAEIILLFTHDDILIGKTLAVQEFEQASARDYGRPARSMGVGMLPIQLAKIMINLARLPKDGALLDPFCGLGTILSEALLMGYQNIIGSDIEQKMVDATRKNLDWQFSVSRETENCRLLRSPVEDLSKHLAPNSIDAIITEPYLGPVRGIRNYELGIMDELKSLYTKAFSEFVKILKSGGRVVFIFPIFATKRRAPPLSGEILPQIKKLGFAPTINPITYSRENQKVLREIFVFEFSKIKGNQL